MSLIVVLLLQCGLLLGVGADPDKLPCRKAKDIRRERKLAKQQASASTVLASSITVSNESKEAAVLSKSSDSTFPAHGQSETRSLEDWILTAIERKDTKHKLTVRLLDNNNNNNTIIYIFLQTIIWCSSLTKGQTKNTKTITYSHNDTIYRYTT